MRLAATLPALAVLLAAPFARADIPPPEGFVEDCTVEKQQRPGMECVECPSSIGAGDKCQNALAPQGYAHACSTYGASAWTEVWCRAQRGATVPVTAPAVAKGCSEARGQERDIVVGLGLAALAGAWALRRSRRRAGLLAS